MRNGLGVMTDGTRVGELLGMAQVPMPLGLSDAALGIAFRNFTVLRSFFGLSCKVPLHVLTAFFARRKGRKSRYLLL